ncbi:MAG: lysophospholipid acyltransferase family protein, partial [FCB group bacterium]|nr:lysophospholipid acyltransferase family protein [FCB group bacterium]
RAPITINGKELLDASLREGKGVLLISGHFGSWEMLAAWLGYNGYPFVGIAQRQKNRGADRFFRELREHSGVRHIFRKAPLDKMYAVLKNGEILGLASDQDARRRGVFVNFFDHPASTPKGAAMFHLRQGAPMLFVVCYETKPYQYVVDIEPIPIRTGDDVTTITQQFTSLLEKKVRQYPSQYFWFHRRWKTKMKEPGHGKNQP